MRQNESRREPCPGTKRSKRGFCNCGAAQASSVMEILTLPGRRVYRVSATDPHPPPFLRVLIAFEWCRHEWGRGDWDDWEREWIATCTKLVEGKSSSEYKPNRYLLHLDCAERARDLLLDIDALDVDDIDAIGSWLENKVVGERIESYRKAYRDITKIDLAETADNIEQDV